MRQMLNNIWSKLSGLIRFRGFFYSRSYRALQAAVLCIFIFFVVVVGILPAQYNLQIGEVADDDIFAPRTTINHIATERARLKEWEAVGDVYTRHDITTDEVISSSTVHLRYITNEEFISLEQPERLAQLKDAFPELDELTLLALSNLEPADNYLLVVNLERFIRERMIAGVKEGEVPQKLQLILADVSGLDADARLLILLSNLVNENFRANLLYDEEATLRERRAARDRVDEVRILKGERIIGKGDVVEQDHLDKLTALGLTAYSINYGYYFGLAVLLLTIFTVWGYFLIRFRPNIFRSNSRTLLLGLIVLITLSAASAVRSADWSPSLIPVAMVPMLFTILFDMQTGLFFGVSVSLIVAIMGGGELNVALMMMIASVIASYSVTNVNQRSDLTRAGILVGLANIVITLGLILIGDGVIITAQGIQGLLKELGLAFGGGLLAAVFATGFLPLFENTFGITTSVRLLELANPNQGPLKRLLLEAPGTYHHSILVGNLAESAAEAVGADSILARVGSYYHDIGKLSRPYFFIENQFSGDNPHDKIPPSLSSMILTAHVRTGLELAAQYKLPQPIRDIIQQHHGDSLIGYFYHRALSERGNKDQLLEDKFRYEGPRPQSKEAAIIMLADSVEAATRSLAQPTQARISNIVRKIIQEKLSDGQLNQCDLTLKELTLIGDSFIRILSGIFHKRIAYPSVQDLKQIIAKEV